MCPLIPEPAPVSMRVAGPASCMFQSKSLLKNSEVRALSRHPISKCTTGRPIAILPGARILEIVLEHRMGVLQRGVKRSFHEPGCITRNSCSELNECELGTSSLSESSFLSRVYLCRD